MAIAQPSNASSPRVLADFAGSTWVANTALILGGSAFVGLCAQVAVPLPFTPVPLTLQTFAVLLVGASLGTWRGVTSLLVYAAAGAAGVPWFAERASGWSMPTFGYILGFIAAAAVVGRLAEQWGTRTPLRTFGVMLIGSAVIHAVGVSYLKFALALPWATALSLGLVPFLIGDAIKAALAAGIIPTTWKLLNRTS